MVKHRNQKRNSKRNDKKQKNRRTRNQHLFKDRIMGGAGELKTIFAKLNTDIEGILKDPLYEGKEKENEKYEKIKERLKQFIKDFSDYVDIYNSDKPDSEKIINSYSSSFRINENFTINKLLAGDDDTFPVKKNYNFIKLNFKLILKKINDNLNGNSYYKSCFEFIKDTFNSYILWPFSSADIYYYNAEKYNDGVDPITIDNYSNDFKKLYDTQYTDNGNEGELYSSKGELSQTNEHIELGRFLLHAFLKAALYTCTQKANIKPEPVTQESTTETKQPIESREQPEEVFDSIYKKLIEIKPLDAKDFFGEYLKLLIDLKLAKELETNITNFETKFSELLNEHYIKKILEEDLKKLYQGENYDQLKRLFTIFKQDVKISAEVLLRIYKDIIDQQIVDDKTKEKIKINSENLKEFIKTIDLNDIKSVTDEKNIKVDNNYLNLIKSAIIAITELYSKLFPVIKSIKDSEISKSIEELKKEIDDDDTFDANNYDKEKIEKIKLTIQKLREKSPDISDEAIKAEIDAIIKHYDDYFAEYKRKKASDQPTGQKPLSEQELSATQFKTDDKQFLEGKKTIKPKLPKAVSSTPVQVQPIQQEIPPDSVSDTIAAPAPDAIEPSKDATDQAVLTTDTEATTIVPPIADTETKSEPSEIEKPSEKDKSIPFNFKESFMLYLDAIADIEENGGDAEDLKQKIIDKIFSGYDEYSKERVMGFLNDNFFDSKYKKTDDKHIDKLKGIIKKGISDKIRTYIKNGKITFDRDKKGDYAINLKLVGENSSDIEEIKKIRVFYETLYHNIKTNDSTIISYEFERETKIKDYKKYKENELKIQIDSIISRITKGRKTEEKIEYSLKGSNIIIPKNSITEQIIKEQIIIQSPFLYILYAYYSYKNESDEKSDIKVEQEILKRYIDRIVGYTIKTIKDSGRDSITIIDNPNDDKIKRLINEAKKQAIKVILLKQMYFDLVDYNEYIKSSITSEDIINPDPKEINEELKAKYKVLYSEIIKIITDNNEINILDEIDNIIKNSNFDPAYVESVRKRMKQIIEIIDEIAPYLIKNKLTIVKKNLSDTKRPLSASSRRQKELPPVISPKGRQIVSQGN
jgi:hypothetical protein